MKKIKLLITSAALLVGGGLLASSSNNIIKANAAEPSISYQFSSLVNNMPYDGNKLKEFIQDDNLMTITATGYVGGFVDNNVHYLRLGSGSKGGGITFEYNESTLIDKIVLYGNFHDSPFNFKVNNIIENSSTEFADGEMEVSLDSTNWFSIATESAKNRLNISKIDIYFLGEETGLTHTVTLMDGENEIGTKEVKDGSSVDLTDVYTDKDDFVFEGWYEDDLFTDPYENEQITDNKTLYAKYRAKVKGDYFAECNTNSSLIANFSKEADDIRQLQPTFEGNTNNWFIENKNEAEKLGLDSAQISVVSSKNNSVRVNNGTFDLMTGCHLTISATYISSISYHCSTNNINNLKFTDADGKEITPSNNLINVNSTSLNIDYPDNGKQVKFDKFDIEINLNHGLNLNATSIRFGTTFDKSYYDENAKYGIILGLGDIDIKTTASEYTKLDDLINDESINNENTRLKYIDTTNTMVPVDRIGALEESNNPETAPYYQYAVLISDMLSHMSQVITAACYMETEDGLYVMSDATYSVKSLAQKYIDDHLADEYSDILNAIINYQE